MTKRTALQSNATDRESDAQEDVDNVQDGLRPAGQGDADDDELLESATYYENEPHDAGVFGKKFKPTLDSDEEDDETEAEKYNVMNMEGMEGQEEATADRDGDIKLTAFNMKEEMDEGHFDRDGTYIFNKDDETKDEWLDNLDKMPISEFAKKNDDLNEDSQPEEPFNVVQAYRDLISILISESESIEEGMRRIGKIANPPRNLKAKDKQSAKTFSAEEKASAKETLNKLIEIADKFISRGDMNVYQKTRKAFQILLKQNDILPVVQNSEDDIFGDNFNSAPTASSSQATNKAATEPSSEKAEEVKWEFKWENVDSAPIYGPYPSNQMLAWVQSEYFAKGVWARQITKRDGPFYNSKRIDFDLYV